MTKLPFLMVFISLALLGLANAQPTNAISAYSNPTLNNCQVLLNQGYNLCNTLTFSPLTTSQIESPSLSSTNTADMIIYLNPAGYFEFAISNNTQTNIFSNTALYQNTAPDQSILFPLNQLSNKNSPTFQGIVFYASATNLDLTPLETDMLQGNGLTPSEFVNYAENNINSLYNSTIIVSNAESSNPCNGVGAIWCSIVDFINPSTNPQNITTIALDTIFPPASIVLGVINTGNALSLQQNYNYFAESPSQSVQFYSEQTNSVEPYSVSFNFEGNMLSGTTTDQLYEFNQYYDNVFLLNYYQNQYYTTVIPTLFFLPFIVILLLAFNGVSS